MTGFVVSRYGTFGYVEREYHTEAGVPMVVIEWGALGWITPVPVSECKQLRYTRWEGEARAEAEAWLAEREPDTAPAQGKGNHE